MDSNKSTISTLTGSVKEDDPDDLDIPRFPCDSRGTMIGSLLALLITLIAIINGYRLASLFRDQFSVWERCCAGAVIGLALLAWIGFLASMIGGLNAATITATVLVEIGITVAFLLRSRETGLVSEFRAAVLTIDRRAAIYYAAWAGLLFWLFARVIMWNGDSLLTAPLNNYGDLPFHLSAITSFAWGNNFPPTNPIFAGARFTYPFLIDFLTAFYLRTGAGLRFAFFLENFILAVSLVGILEMLAVRLTGNILAARIAPVIFLFNGGFGFINFFSDLSLAKGLFGTLADLPRTYTMNATLSTRFGQIPLVWGNVFTTLIIPQRSLLFGLPVVALIIVLWWTALREKTETGPKRRLLLASGVLAGCLPMLHAHSFFAIVIVSVLLIVLFWSFDWLAFLIPLAVLAGPQALFLMGTPVRNQLFKEHLGWESGSVSPVLFWLANAGPFIFLLISAIGTRALVDARTRRFYLPFLLWFFLPNLVLLAPWPWDNIKVLILWGMVSAPFVALVLADGFRRPKLWKASSALLLIILTLSGILDVTRALSPVEKVTLLGGDETIAADAIRTKTEPGSVIAHAPIHNSAVCFTGRRSLMGYPGHLWTHGIDYGTREQDTRTLFLGGSKAREIIDRYKVDYLLVGPIERRVFTPDEKALAAEYPVVFDLANYRLYRVRR